MGKGALIGAIGGVFGGIGGAGMNFSANLGLGMAEGAVTGFLDAALWNGDKMKGILWGAASGAVFTTLTSQNMKNMVKGKGFRTNAKVFENFKLGKYTGEGGIWQQDAIDYFGFQGKYVPEDGQSSFVIISNKEGKVLSSDIRFRDDAFDSYNVLYNTYTKESFSYNRFQKSGKKGLELVDYAEWTDAMQPEERLGVIHQYKNQGLYPNDSYHYLDAIRSVERRININNEIYKPIIYQYTPYKEEWWHFIYKTPRRW